MNRLIPLSSLRFLLLALALLASSCAYKVEIKQGDETLLEGIEQLQIGMTQDEVVQLLGPVQTPRLFKQNIWIYAYQLRSAGFTSKPQLRSVELVFDANGTLQVIRELHNDYAETDDAN
ncbi:MAG: outer membrane protein assembly factor BamE [Proteobacteria bacterium]|nr:outer membrane protein assembly factor BamE [Pseudomonadota bacterium]MCH9757522.1 outer membrane protein assembly factor BamE [Pseudomonadota bacterium]